MLSVLRRSASFTLFCVLVGTLTPLSYGSYYFSTVAGVCGKGSVDGLGVSARFNEPVGVTADLAGNLYVCDTYNDTIRKITPSGMVTTLAGAAGVVGLRDGIGAAAQFDHPEGIAVDSSGNLYIADTGNSAIRRITSDGLVTTLAGGQSYGSADGQGSAARFWAPAGIAIDQAGTIYVADTGSNTIRKVTPTGAVTTVAGSAIVADGGSRDGVGSGALFLHPRGVTIDTHGNIFVADTGNRTVRKITSTGVVTTIAGPPVPTGGLAGPSELLSPIGIVVDADGNVFVADEAALAIKRISPAGVVTTIAGAGDGSGWADGTGSAARFGSPFGLALGAAGMIYVADATNCMIRQISPTFVVTTIAGQSPLGAYVDGTGSAARFNAPQGVAVDPSGNIYIADTFNEVIRKISAGNVVTTFAGSVGSSGNIDGAADVARFHDPFGLATDAAGNVYVADFGNASIRKITPAGMVTTLASGKPGIGPSNVIGGPVALALDAGGNVYVADAGIAGIFKITPAGVVSVFAGGGGGSGETDGTGKGAAFDGASGIAVGSDGNIFVADAAGRTIRKITPEGVVTTFAGAAWDSGSADGNGTSARFSYPTSLSVDASGNIYVADSWNGTVRKITAAGDVTTIGGTPGKIGNADGFGSTARFSSAFSIAADASGNVFVADTGSNVVRKGVPSERLPSTTRLVNISTRAYGGTGNNVTIGGFVIAGTGFKHLLLRAVGPTLANLGLGQSEVMADPTIEVHDALHANSVIATIDNWGDNNNPGDIAKTGSELGAFALASGDMKSSAVLLSLPPGVYSFIARDKSSASGIVLVEAYDADPLAAGSTFVNISARVYCATGNQVAIGGFVVSGNNPKHLLLRAVGPTLASLGLGTAEVLGDPMIDVHDALHGNSVIAKNDNWGDNGASADVIATGQHVGATPLSSSDMTSAAMVVTLQPGVYSFTAGGKAGGAGIVLIEVYDAD